MALRADHGGGPEPRPGPSDPARSRRRKTPVQPSPGRPGPPGSAWTRPTDPWRASWEHPRVNPDPRTGHPTTPATPHGPAAPLDAQDPAGITTTLKDTPASGWSGTGPGARPGPTGGGDAQPAALQRFRSAPTRWAGAGESLGGDLPSSGRERRALGAQVVKPARQRRSAADAALTEPVRAIARGGPDHGLAQDRLPSSTGPPSRRMGE